MAQPRAYVKATTFNDFTTTNPSDPHSGSDLDTEFVEIKQNTDDLNTNIALIQRDDGKLKNEAVHKDAFDQDSLALIGLSGYTLKGAWAATTAYVVGDLVTNNDATYVATTAHTSGATFSSTNWILIANSAIEATGASVNTHNGTGSQTVFATTYDYSGVTDIQVFVAGSLVATNLYTVGTNIITFTSAPASGTNNVIIWGDAVISQTAIGTTLGYRDTTNNHKTTASRWATLTTDSVTDAETSVDSSEYSAKAYAVGGTEVTGATNKGAAKDWAVGAGGVMATRPDGAEYSSKEYATGTTAPLGSAKSWSTKDTTAVASSLFSAKEYASGSSATGGTSKQWALGGGSHVEATAVTGSNYSARKYATDSAGSASAASTSEGNAATSYDNFDDRFLGPHTTAQREVGVANIGKDHDGDSLVSGALYFDTTLGVMKVWNGSLWKQLTPTTAEQTQINTLTTGYDGTTSTTPGTNLNIVQVDTVADAVVNVNTVAGKNTEIGLLGTNAMASGSAAYLAVLGTPAMTHVSTGYLKLVGDIDDKVTTVAGIHANVTTVAGISANVTTVATNITGVNNFALRYRIGATDPTSSLDDGDLFWNTSTDELKIYDSTAGAWAVPYLDSTSVDTVANNAAVAMSIALG